MSKSLLKSFLPLITLLFLFACSSGDKKPKESILPDSTGANSPLPPPATNPPGVEIVKNEKKCYSNDGLKYQLEISMSREGDKVFGTVVSDAMDGSAKTSMGYNGSVEGDKITVKFIDKPPIAGDASEWTNKPWTLDTKSAKEKLVIVFNAKNYETNKWEDTNYEFELTACK